MILPIKNEEINQIGTTIKNIKKSINERIDGLEKDSEKKSLITRKGKEEKKEEE